MNCNNNRFKYLNIKDDSLTLDIGTLNKLKDKENKVILFESLSDFVKPTEPSFAIDKDTKILYYGINGRWTKLSDNPTNINHFDFTQYDTKALMDADASNKNTNDQAYAKDTNSLYAIIDTNGVKSWEKLDLGSYTKAESDGKYALKGAGGTHYTSADFVNDVKTQDIGTLTTTAQSVSGAITELQNGVKNSQDDLGMALDTSRGQIELISTNPITSLDDSGNRHIPTQDYHVTDKEYVDEQDLILQTDVDNVKTEIGKIGIDIYGTELKPIFNGSINPVVTSGSSKYTWTIVGGANGISNGDKVTLLFNDPLHLSDLTVEVDKLYTPLNTLYTGSGVGATGNAKLSIVGNDLVYELNKGSNTWYSRPLTTAYKPASGTQFQSKTIADTNNYFTATNVEGALDELHEADKLQDTTIAQLSALVQKGFSAEHVVEFGGSSGNVDKTSALATIVNPQEGEKAFVVDLGNSKSFLDVYHNNGWVQLTDNVGGNIDLSNYNTIAQSDAKYLTQTNAVANYQPKGTYLTQHQDISGKADVGDSYTKAESDGKYLTAHQDITGKQDKVILDTNNHFTATNVEGVLDEIYNSINGIKQVVGNDLGSFNKVTDLPTASATNVGNTAEVIADTDSHHNGHYVVFKNLVNGVNVFKWVQLSEKPVQGQVINVSDFVEKKTKVHQILDSNNGLIVKALEQATGEKYESWLALGNTPAKKGAIDMTSKHTDSTGLQTKVQLVFDGDGQLKFKIKTQKGFVLTNLDYIPNADDSIVNKKYVDTQISTSHPHLIDAGVIDNSNKATDLPSLTTQSTGTFFDYEADDDTTLGLIKGNHYLVVDKPTIHYLETEKKPVSATTTVNKYVSYTTDANAVSPEKTSFFVGNKLPNGVYQSYGRNSAGDQSYGFGATGGQNYGFSASGNQTYGFGATGNQAYGEASWSGMGAGKTVEFYFGKQLASVYEKDTDKTYFYTSADGRHWTKTTHTADTLVKKLDKSGSWLGSKTTAEEPALLTEENVGNFYEVV